MEPFVIDKFAGLNLVDNVSEIGLNGAVDVSDVTFDYPGRIRTRPGTSVFVSGTSRDFNSLFVAAQRMAVDDANDLMRVYNDAGGEVVTSAHPDGTAASYARYSTSVVYYTGGATQQIKKYGASSITSPAGLATINGTVIAVQPIEDRLVVGNAASTTGRLHFSNPGTPETFTADDFIDLTGSVTALVSWDGQLYAFEADRFHVFYGNSTDATGGSIFNYRTINTGIGCVGLDMAAAGRDGVYFYSRDGVYRTRGDRPESVSGPIAAKWEANGLPMPPSFGGSSTQITAGVLARGFGVANDAVYMSYGSETFVFDNGQWSMFSFGADSIQQAPNSGELVTFLDGDIKTLSSSETTDSGVAITARYQSGFYDLGSPVIKRVRETLLDGQGVVSVDLRADYASSGTPASVTLGVAPVTAQGRVRAGRRGRLLSHRLSGSGAWVVDRMVHHIAGQQVVR